MTLADPLSKRTEIYVVLLYPPVGSPHVTALPEPPPGISLPCQTFATFEHAEAALEKFLTENPEYRRWRDGHIQPE